MVSTEMFVAALDFIGAIGFLGATVVAYMNYQDTKRVSGFWANYTFASLLGFLWTGAVMWEWAGGPAILDVVSVSLMTVTVGVFAMVAIGTLSVVEDIEIA